MPNPIILLTFLYGGFITSFSVGVSYFIARNIPKNQRIRLGLICFTPLISILLLFGGLYVSGHQGLAILPCLFGALFFGVEIFSGTPTAFSRSPIRCSLGLISILWACATVFIVSDYGFAGAGV